MGSCSCLFGKCSPKILWYINGRAFQKPKNCTESSQLTSVSKFSTHQLKRGGLIFNEIFSKKVIQECIRKLSDEEGHHNMGSYGVKRVCDTAVCDMVFDVLKDEENEKVPITKLLNGITDSGLRLTDPRLEGFKIKVDEALNEFTPSHEVETLQLDRESFKRIIEPNCSLISRVFQGDLIIPDFPIFCAEIKQIYEKLASDRRGKLASYIPQLATMDPNLWGISICSVDGQRWSFGDDNVPFTIQSCSKPISYAMALQELGDETVHKYVGHEPSGRIFNDLILNYNKKPHNPMINAGAIVICSLLHTLVNVGKTNAEKLDYSVNYFKRMAGNEYMEYNHSVFLSERKSADRNYALGYYMREHKCFHENTNLRDSLDFYFQCCSIESTTEAMSVLAATLANGGECPISEEIVAAPKAIQNVLSLMYSCGMYDYSGQFAFKVGIPGKSGVSGCMILVIPGVMGISTFSPPLDRHSNSQRGLRFCEELGAKYAFHTYDNLKHISDKIDPTKRKYDSLGSLVTNLLFAASNGDLQTLRRYNLAGFNLMVKDYDGRTALHLAAAEGHLNCVKFLLENNFNRHIRDRWGNTALDDALRFNRVEVIKLLEDRKSVYNDKFNE